MVIHPQFKSSYGCYDEFHEGLSAVSLEEQLTVKGKRVKKIKWGFVDKVGKLTIVPGATFLSDLREGLAFFHKGGLTGYIDRDLKVVIKPQFKSAGNFYFGRARATGLDGKEFYVDKLGNPLFENRDGGEFQDSRAFFKVKGKYGFIDLTGHVIIEAQFDGADHFGEGLAGVKIGAKWGFVDGRGVVMITPRFDSVGVFSEGLVSIELNGKWGFANKKGEIVVPPQFDKWTYYFEKGLCAVRLDGKMGYIDHTGNFVWPLTG